MSRFRVVKVAVITLCTALTLGSCGSSLSRKISIDGYDNLSLMGLSGAKVDLNVRNESGYNIRVKELRLTLREANKDIGTASLTAETQIARRSELVVVPTTWRFSDINAIAALSASSRIFNNSKNGAFVVDVEGKVKLLLINKRIEQKNIPLKTLLNEIQ